MALSPDDALRKARHKGSATPSRTDPGLAVLDDGEAATSPDKPSGVPALGTLVAGKYVIERQLGAGGMGVVLAARHVQLEQRVAIKFLRSRARHESTAVERFLREARAAVALSSDHVARVLDVGTLESGEPFMVMEYLDGVDLGQVLDQKGPLPIPEAIDSVLQASEAIAEAHSLGIVHRDLKPSNLFRNNRRDGRTIVKVLDFGISKSADFNTAKSEKNLTASGLVMGSPGYMSPEQVRNARTVDVRSDVWALGVILYELITGVRPFAGETAGDTFARIIAEKPPSIRNHRPDAPAGLAEVIAQCLEVRVSDRIQSVGELASRLVSYGSKDAGPLVERIVRWSAAKPEPAKAASEPVKHSANSASSDSGLEPKASPGTGPAWLKSRASTSFKPPMHRRLPVVVLATIGVTLVAVSLFALGGRTRRRDTVLASPPSAVAPVQVPIAIDSAMSLPSAGLSSAGPRDAEGLAPANAQQAGEKTTLPAATFGPAPKTPKVPPSKRASPATSAATGQREIF